MISLWVNSRVELDKMYNHVNRRLCDVGEEKAEHDEEERRIKKQNNNDDEEKRKAKQKDKSWKNILKGGTEK
jgi:hypothetical protein